MKQVAAWVLEEIFQKKNRLILVLPPVDVENLANTYYIIEKPVCLFVDSS